MSQGIRGFNSVAAILLACAIAGAFLSFRAEEAHRAWLYGAGGCLVGALICVALARSTPKALREAHPALPLPDWETQLRLVAPWAWPSLSLLVFAVLLGAYAAPVIEPVIEWARHQRELPPAILVSMIQIAIVSITVAAILAALAWNASKAQRQSKLAKFEPLYNLGALVWLKRSRAWRDLCRDDEHPLEVIQTFVPHPGYLLLTNQRLLHFRQGSAPQPDDAWEYGNIVSAKVGEEPPDAVKKWNAAKLSAFAHLSIDAGEYQAVIYRILSRCTATRICSNLCGIPAHPPTPDKPAPDKAAQDGKEIGKPWQQTLCAALVPGLGQWMQRRTGTALSLFLAAACILTFMLFPLAMTLINGSADVCPSVEWKYAKVWGFLSLISALDAWSMARQNITHRPKPK